MVIAVAATAFIIIVVVIIASHCIWHALKQNNSQRTQQTKAAATITKVETKTAQEVPGCKERNEQCIGMCVYACEPSIIVCCCHWHEIV